MPKLSLEEKEFLQRICAISKKDKQTVKDVLLSLLMVSTIEIYKETNTIIIPYICSLKVEHFDKMTPKGVKVEVVLEAIPSTALIEEITAVSEGEITPSEKYVKKQIFKIFLDLLVLDDVELIDE